MAPTTTSGPRILLLDSRYAHVWRRVLPHVRFSLLESAGETPSLEPGSDVPGEDRLIFRLAQEHAGKFDYILGECTGAFLWHAVFRLVGDTTPFLIVPRYNHVLAPHAYALLLSSQLSLPQDVVFAGCEAASRSFSAFGFRGDPLFLPGIDLDSFQLLPDRRAELRRSLDLPAEEDVMLFVGRLEEDKNVLELLEVVARVCRERPVTMVICYHFHHKSYLELCRKRAEQIGGVHFVHAPDKQRLVRYYNTADLFVSAAVSIFETFGRAPVEAMACGTPSVVSEYDGFRKTVPRDVGRLVPAIRDEHRCRPDIPGLSRAVLEMLEDRQELAERSRAGISYARRFDEPTAMGELGDRLDRLAAAVSSNGGSPLAERLSLSGYPAAAQKLWAPLEGRSVGDLLRQFVAGWKVPVRPSRDTIREFYWSWFAHY